jgi:hypothetical protein
MSDATSRVIQLPDQEPSGPNVRAAWKAMKVLWPEGVPSDLGSSVILRRVNLFIKKQPPNTIDVNEVTRDSVRRLLGRK